MRLRCLYPVGWWVVGVSQAGGGEWESPSQWLERTGRLIGAIACLAAQQEQHPFSLEDIWKWLAEILNNLCRYQGQETRCHMS